ncbi:MAG: ABC transporter substrate-binding protein [Lachnospiraceae bacterium]|nr:ABC transporter substrate-binding protein [Lachnospiraceae bacterium]
MNRSIVIKNTKKLIIIILSFVILTGCSSGTASDPAINKSVSGTAADKNVTEPDKNGIVTVTDMEGNDVEVPVNVEKVACISQSATDLMIAFGLGDKIVGTYRSFTYNPWAGVIYPKALEYKAYSYSVSAEELLKDGVELVIIQDTENAEAFRNAGIPVIAVHQYSPEGVFDEEIYETAHILGEIFGEETKREAAEWERDVKDAINEVSSLKKSTCDETVYYINGEKQKGLFYSDGGNSMISSILSTAGLSLATEKYEVLNVHDVSDEEMIKLNPDAMLIGGAYQNYLMQELYDSELWSNLDCVKNDRVYRIPVAMTGIENVSAETPVMIRYTASLFYPDYDYDLDKDLKENIKKYFDYDLSSEDVYNMKNAFSKDGEVMVNAE